MEEASSVRPLRNAAIVMFIFTMTLLLVGGIYHKEQVPPIPSAMVSGGAELTTSAAISRGQDVYQRYGLMDHGSIWGHGTLRGMDFTADTLHRTGQWMREFYAARGTPVAASLPSQDEPLAAYRALPHNEQRSIDAQVIEEIKANAYDGNTHALALTPGQRYAFEQNRRYWDDQFDKGNPHVGFLPGTVPPAAQRQDIADFFFWTAWAAGANRPGLAYTYTSNWPADRSVGNEASANAMLWTILSVFTFMAVLGTVIYIVHRFKFFYGPPRGVQASMRLMESPITPSQRATAKFFLVAGLLFLVQILNGGLLANYTVRPATFYVQMIGEKYSYSWAKTWHVQLAILWMAVAWIGTSVYLAPLIARREPRGQRTLVNLLFGATFIVIAGSLIGEVVSIKGGFGPDVWYWLGHQGWEYLELGRLWQILLLAGMVFWLVIVYRTMAGVIARKSAEYDPHTKGLIVFYILSAILIVGFFAFGLFYSRGTHISVADYWRWFVVHIWVESIFEFFGVAIVALFLVSLGLVSAHSALRVAYLTAILVFLGGVPGVAHHYFWFGGPAFWLAIGGVFSIIEVIPLILLVVRGWMEYRSIRRAGGDFPYRWPLYFLVASSFWNFLGAGIFGFIINLPIVNYYSHATYLTANHAHTALFGVYGMLAVALILFSWRGLVDKAHWKDGILRFSFWGMNVGLFLMFAVTLLPMGLLQVWHSFASGPWWARSHHFYELPLVQWLAEVRIIPDTVIILFGAIPLLWFLVRTYPFIRKS